MEGIKKKTLLLLTFLKYGDIVGRKRFQKLMYLAKHKYNIEVPFIFVKHLYGPYSREMQTVLDNLVTHGLVRETKIIGNEGIVEYKYSLTDRGKFALSIIPFNVNEERKIKKLIEKYKYKSTKDIVKEVYEHAGIEE